MQKGISQETTIGESVKNKNESINNGIEGQGIMYSSDQISIEIRSL